MDRTERYTSSAHEEPDLELQDANEEPPLPRFSIRRKGTQINLGLLLLIALGITSVVVGNRSFDDIEAAVSRDVEDLVQSEAPEGVPPGELMGRTAGALSSGRMWSRGMGIGFVALAVFLTTVLILLGMRLITIELWIRRMGAGDLDYRPAIRGKDEVTETARSVEELGQRSIKALQLDLVKRLSEGLKEKNEELEQLVDELRQRQEQIIMRRKLVELGELTAGVAHEIRNPLNFMRNFSEASRELLEELQHALGESADRREGDGREEIDELTRHLGLNLTRILEHGDRVERIVRDMVQIGRGGGELQWVTMNDLLAKQASLAYQSVRAQNQEFRVDIRHEFDPDVGRVRVVAEDMSRVFINVMQNACYWTAEKKHAGNGGEGAYVPTVWLKTRRRGDEIEIRIRDNGSGIPGDVIDKVFNPFFTTKPTDKGTGLGLSLSHDIVRQHGGSISPRSEPGEFTEMIIRIPAGADAAAVA